jgi:Acyl-CoA dehydrogenase, C-terminal domain
VDFRYTPDEVEIIGYARESFRAHLPLGRLRAGSETTGAWAAIGRDGWLHACLPDNESPADLALLAGLAREAGAVAAGEEFVQNGWLIPRLCGAIENPSTRTNWLTEQHGRPGYLRDAETSIALAAHPGFDRYGLQRSADGWRRLQRWRDGDVTIAALADLSASVSRVTSTGGEASEAALQATPEYIRLTEAGTRTLGAATAVGLAAEILDQTVGYICERHQFGRPIGQFQAVKHLCADLHTELQVAWLAVQYSAVGWHTDSLAVHQAANQAAEVALSAARTGAQLHGGMGFTWECDLHWLLKSALDTQLSLGTPATSASMIGAALLEAG